MPTDPDPLSPTEPKALTGSLTRAITAEIRAAMARQRMSGLRLAQRAGMSQNYLAKRLRDDAQLTLEDFFKLCAILEVDPMAILTTVTTEADDRLAEVRSIEQRLDSIRQRTETADPSDLEKIKGELLGTIDRLSRLSSFWDGDAEHSAETAALLAKYRAMRDGRADG